MFIEDDYVLVETYPKPLPPPISLDPPERTKPPPLPASPDPPAYSQPAQARELNWLLNSLQATLLSLKHGLEECYALLAPIDPGSTLVLSTPRAELVKGHVTRVGARIVKGTIHTKLRTTAPWTISINPAHPIHLAPLVTLNTLLTQAVDLASLCCTEVERNGQKDHPATAAFLSSQLRLLAQGIDEASAILKGANKPPQSPFTKTTSRPPTAVADANVVPASSSSSIPESDWTQYSAASTSFTPPLSHVLSFHVTIQDACLVLHLRALEPADAPVNLGIKLALAIGTARRLEHDEAEKVFTYRHHDSDPSIPQTGPGQSQSYPTRGSRGPAGKNGSPVSEHGGGGEVEKVYVREKVRVESADPCLLSMSTKLSALSNSLNMARRNLAAVMGEELE
ncbi:RAVE subunit 2/Rogdi [Xylaria cf. heliscus]|nr:RAVE subunit 2/Rogdi [Xylaria cf. heliscus]